MIAYIVEIQKSMNLTNLSQVAKLNYGILLFCWVFEVIMP